MSAYTEIEKRFKERHLIDTINSVLNWDMETYMPKGANDFRGDQIAYLSEKSQEIMLRPDWPELIASAKGEKGLDNWQTANIKRAARILALSDGISAELVGKLAKAISDSLAAWREAKPKNDFKAWLPYFEKVLDLTKETAEITGQKMGLSPYDALLESYQSDIHQAQIDPIFNELKTFLPDLIQKIQTQRSPSFQFKEDYKGIGQDKLNALLAKTIGLDFNRSRIDKSVHGFCTDLGEDIRITASEKNDPMEIALTIIHETGHAIYDQNLPPKWRGQPVGSNLGMAAHESQSLFWERQITGNEGFISFLTREMKKIFGYGEITHDNLLARLRDAKPSFIRTAADEVTYPLHVILRYEIERALIGGDVTPKDVPALWNEKMRAYLGIVPPTDTLGCLQDIHWPGGMIGYFPSYSMGAVTAAQWMHAMTAETPDILDGLKNGDCTRVHEWLKKNIHSKGCLVSFPQLVKDVTGEALTAKYFKAHLTNRYLKG
ncbi:MAG: carboxypeptidase M32 [Lactobacillales bacterium]|jgi:carboxypeptidase Taq|nr:carboxypeptidase M32 [Lactobacillales bacterium]